MAQRYALWALYEKIPDSIPGSSNSKNDFSKLGVVCVFCVMRRSELHCFHARNIGNSLV